MILMTRKRFWFFFKFLWLPKSKDFPTKNLNKKGNQEEYDQDEYIEFLNHLSDINATATKIDMIESDDDPEREDEIRLQAKEALIA